MPLRDRQAIFDGSIQLGAALSGTFSRAAATVDYAGQAVSSGTPRFGRPAALAGLPRWTAAKLDGNDINGGDWYMASVGKDADGNWIGWLKDVDATEFYIAQQDPATGDLTAAVSVTKTTKTGDKRHFSGLAPAGSKYADDATWAIDNPQHAQIMRRGFVVVQAEAYKDTVGDGSNWQVQGTVLIGSKDAGTTWEVLADDSPGNDAGAGRAQVRWCMGNWTTPWSRGNDEPTLMAWATTDYLTGGGGGDSGAMRFGLAYVDANGDKQWSAVYEYSIDSGISHAHTCAIVEHTLDDDRKTIALLVSIGDGVAINRIERHIFDDGTIDFGTMTAAELGALDFSEATDWTVDTDFYGDNAGRGEESLQPISWAPARDFGEVVFGGDNKSEVLYRAVPTATGMEIHPLRVNADSAGVCFDIIASKPSSGEFTARVAMHASGSEAASGSSSTWIYTNDYGEHFVPVGSAREQDAVNYVAVMGDWMYQSSTTGITKARKPTGIKKNWRPIQIAPGGVNFCEEGFPAYTVSGTHTVSTITKHTDGYFYDFTTTPGDENGEEAFRLPLPPFQTDRIGRIVVNSSESSTTLLSAGSNNNSVASVGYWDNSGEAVTRRNRLWMLCGDRDRGMSLNTQLADGGGNTGFVRSQTNAHPTSSLATIGSREQWLAMCGEISMAVGTGRTIRMPFQSGHGPNPPGAKMFIAMDNCREGAGGVGWPLPMHDDPGVANLTDYPDEALPVSGLNFADGEAFRCIGRLPEHAWDTFYGANGAGRIHVLCTLYADDENYIEVCADTTDANRCILIRGKANNVAFTELELDGSIYFNRGLLLDIAIARDGATLTVVASVDGVESSGTIEDATDMATLTAWKPASIADVVEDFDWFGFEVRDDVDPDETGLQGLLAEAFGPPGSAGFGLYTVLDRGGRLRAAERLRI